MEKLSWNPYSGISAAILLSSVFNIVHNVLGAQVKQVYGPCAKLTLCKQPQFPSHRIGDNTAFNGTFLIFRLSFSNSLATKIKQRVLKKQTHKLEINQVNV